jgi:hypothetical protein
MEISVIESLFALLNEGNDHKNVFCNTGKHNYAVSSAPKTVRTLADRGYYDILLLTRQAESFDEQRVHNTVVTVLCE